MWIIQNSMEVHKVLRDCHIARNIKTFDFSTLYTSIPHHKLKDKISSLVIKAFDSQDWKYIIVNNQARWSKTEKNGVCLTSESICKLIDWLIDNTYVTIGDKMFKQIIGIPMGTDCAPYLANLFLNSY